MTCIAALKKKNGKIIIASDRRMSWGMGKQQKKPKPKSVGKGGLLVAGTGSCFVLSLAREVLEFPEIGKDQDPVQYMNNEFSFALRKLLLDKGMGSNNELKVPQDLSAALLVACKGHLFEVDMAASPETSSVIIIDEINTPYASGCGGALALGSLMTTEGSKLTERERLKIALKVAAKVSPGCDGNIDYVEEK